MMDSPALKRVVTMAVRKRSSSVGDKTPQTLKVRMSQVPQGRPHGSISCWLGGVVAIAVLADQLKFTMIIVVTGRWERQGILDLCHGSAAPTGPPCDPNLLSALANGDDATF